MIFEKDIGVQTRIGMHKIRPEIELTQIIFYKISIDYVERGLEIKRRKKSFLFAWYISHNTEYTTRVFC